ncbi:MAG: TadE/TadG family type IV pilus assembly protein [Pseudomonadota bacterium]
MALDQGKQLGRKSDVKEMLRLFAKQEDGMMTVFACFMILIMLMVGGIGVDLMRNEMERTRLQSVADRAVLAAADLDQKLSPQAVVQDYFDKAGMGDYVSSVTVDQGLNYRTVTVDASTMMNTQFMGAMGVDELVVPAQATAEEKVNKVEISLVLDVSGSMKWGTKMAEMQAAAGAFVDAVLKEENENLISVNLIPYSQHVNAGPLIYDQLNMYTKHNYSHCVEFDDGDFNHIHLDTGKWYDQMQHFQWNTYSNESGNRQNTRYDTVCPRYAYERILPMSQDATELKSQINQLKPRAGTQIFYGMKWATAMLDPSFGSINSTLVNQGHVDAVFASRPAAHNDEETLKTIVLMTDGQNSSAARIKNRYYNSRSEYVHWNNYNFNYYLWNYVSSWRHGNFYYTKYTEARGDTLLANMCNAAKEANIVIWTIGFEVEDHGANVMNDCASSPSHFFRVEGVDIHDAFDAIAKSINQLRLTQ